VCFTDKIKDNRCNYPNYNCTTCNDINATLIDDICQCNDGFIGQGYIQCFIDGIY